MALSSSLTSKPKFKYDVFLSFRGKDTRYAFTGNLYFSLLQKGINTFMDDEELGRGEQISPTILKAIEESKIAIIVFSENYASSTWCLDELIKILKCMKQQNQLVFPIFYKVEPSTIRHQTNSYGEAMAKHEKSFKMDKVPKWRLALFEAANLSGWEFKSGYEFQFVEMIVKEAFTKLNSRHLHTGENLVGLKYHVKEVNQLLDIGFNKSSLMFGIYGQGGIGKTTLARVLYDMIVDQFECSCFLDDIREIFNIKGLLKLQKTLVSKTLGEKFVKFSNVHEGVCMIRDRLRFKRVLLVLDDVDKLEHLQMLAGECDWFGSSSRIIITTRNKHLLITHQIEKIYQMKELNDHEALELFSWNAFKRRHPPSSHLNISKRIVYYAKCLPLALRVIGSDLFGKSLDQWESALSKYERIPNGELLKVLRISYDSLEENEKNIFLDVACFFNWEKLEYVEKIFDACDFYSQYGIGVLVDKSLISIEDGMMKIHDLIRDMGREIVRQISPLEPGKRSRLWFYEDVLEVLTQNTGTNNIEGVMLDLPKPEIVDWSGSAFKKMKNLRILVIRNAKFSIGPKYLPNNLSLFEWKEYPSKSLPPGFHPKKLVAFNLPSSCITIDKPFKGFQFLIEMNFSDCPFITQTFDFSGVPNLQYLYLNDCTNLAKVHDSIGFLSKLVNLSFYGCYNLKYFPRSIHLPSLVYLSLEDCRRLEFFPNILGKMEKLLYVRLHGSAIKELPNFSGVPNLRGLFLYGFTNLVKVHDSIGFLDKLVDLYIEGCYNLKYFPSGIHLPYLEHLNLNNCKRLEFFPNILGKMENLHFLHFAGSAIKQLPDSFGSLTGLVSLSVGSCKCLRNLPFDLSMLPCLSRIHMGDSPQLVKSLIKVDVISNPSLHGLTLDNCSLSVDDLHMIFNHFPNLLELSLRGSNIEGLPTCIKEVVNLRFLFVDDCMNLREIPEIPSKLNTIMARNCKSLTSESSSRLWNQAFKEVRDLHVRMPMTEIPEWFDHRNMEETVSFWIRHKFPIIALAFGFKNLCKLENEILSETMGTNIDVHIFINGVEVMRHFFSYPIAGGHVGFFDMRDIFKECGSPDEFLEHNWNYVEICCSNSRPDLPKMTVEYCGIHVYKQETNMADIQFHCPVNLSKRPASFSLQHDRPKKLIKGDKDEGKDKLIDNDN